MVGLVAAALGFGTVLRENSCKILLIMKGLQRLIIVGFVARLNKTSACNSVISSVNQTVPSANGGAPTLSPCGMMDLAAAGSSLTVCLVTTALRSSSFWVVFDVSSLEYDLCSRDTKPSPATV